MSFQTVLQVLGGVALLIYGIKIMGEALQELAGDRLRRLISSLTGTPLRGVAVGALVTMIIQSSSATTVMVVSFVHVGLMTLTQAVGVIMGANIGTTITAQLMAFSIKKYAIIGAIVGAGLSILGKNRRHKQLGAGLVGFSLLFIGMGMMQNAMSFLEGRQELFLPFREHLILAVLAGTIVTMLVQASAATVGLTMAMASQGLIPLDVAIAIIFGDNIGTTITAVLSSLGGNRAAKQAATAHVMFNVIGTSIMMLLISPFSKLVMLTSHDIGRQVANAHSIFNILNTCMFLPFVRPYAAFIQRLVPNKETMPEHGARFLDRNLIESAPAAAIDAVRKEMVRMGKIAYDMLLGCRKAILERDDKIVPELLQTEKMINALTYDIVNYATELGQKGLSPDLALILNSCIGGVGDIERMGDHGENLLEMSQFLADKGQILTPKAHAECEEMFDLVLEAVLLSIQSVENEDIKTAQQVMDLEPKIDQMEKTLRFRHIERLNTGECNPSSGVVFIDILSNLERVGDHAHNVACITKDIDRIRKGMI